MCLSVGALNWMGKWEIRLQIPILMASSLGRAKQGSMPRGWTGNKCWMLLSELAVFMPRVAVKL
jgi:hypothetical protein